MFEEAVEIHPKIPPKEAKKLEKTLSQRFIASTKKFEGRFKDIMKLGGIGGVASIIGGLGAKLLSPMDQLEERLNNLMEVSKNLANSADKFNTSAGKMRKLQELSGLSGMTPDELESMMSAFKENQKKLGEDFQGKDTAESFFQFIQALKAKTDQDNKRIENLRREGKSNEVIIKERDKADKERKAFETLAFGSEQYGTAKAFINQNQASARSQLNTPSVQKINSATEKAQKIAYKDRLQNIQRESQSYSDRGNNQNDRLLKMIHERKNVEEENLRKLEKNASQLEALVAAQNKTNEIMTSVQINTAKTVQLFSDGFGWVKKKLGFGGGENQK